MKTYSFILGLLTLSFNAWSNPYIIRHSSSETYLKVEVLKARGLHFEIIKSKPALDRIWTSPMIMQTPELGKASMAGTKITSDDFIVEVNPDNLCVAIKDLHQNWDFITTCPHNVNEAWKGLALFTNDARNAYGLGAYYQNAGTADGDWVGKVWDPLEYTMGNALRGFSSGAQSYSMFPVLYVQGTGKRNYMMVYDSVYKQMWALNQSPWKVQGYGEQIRWFIYTDEQVKKLRQKFMQLTGKAPVPPKPAFGMWLSEFGYDSWGEAYEKIESMHKEQMPVDGIALDLQWFGGSFYQGNVDRSGSRFGTLEFDQHHFPNPKETINHLRDVKGVEVMAIEESYISQWLTEFKLLDQRGFMAKNCHDGKSTILTANPWWGIGGMLDWTNPQAALYWHNLKRQKLYDLGISYHWTDLGEPEMYSEGSCYYGFPELKKHQHSDIHNIFNLKWIEGIAKGYEHNKNSKRPFAMSRSGTIGIQRHGAAMWSGDIGANMGALTAHYNAQMHMSYSGVDYFGADVGGFHRRPDTLDGDQDELYTQWFANAALFDFPVRGHTWNLSNGLQTIPSEIGDLASNKFNLRLRYSLGPYYYSLAHEAYQQGLPIIVPMAMEFPEDLKVRQMGNQKMIGSHLMGAMAARYGERERDVYLPAGEWIDYHRGSKYVSRGEVVARIPVVEQGVFRLPLFVKKGAIIPKLNMQVQRLNLLGKLADGSNNQDLELLIYPSEVATEFTLYEDDGVSTAYKTGSVAKTKISQQLNGKKHAIVLEASQGSYAGMGATRKYDLQVYNQRPVTGVLFNQVALRPCGDKPIACYQQEAGMLKISLGEQKPSLKKAVEVQF